MGIAEAIAVMNMIQVGTGVVKSILPLFVHRDPASGAITKLQIIAILNEADLKDAESLALLAQANAQV